MLAFALAWALAQEAPAAPPAAPQATIADLRSAAAVAGLELTEPELELMARKVRENIAGYGKRRARTLDNAVPPAFRFAPLGAPRKAEAAPPVPLPEAERPANLADLAFADLRTLASLVKSKRVSCLELTDLSLSRLRAVDPTLHCVVTLLDDRARDRAEELDALLEQGTWLGPLHGIPFGAKDLLSARGAPTTWGAEPYRDQVIDADAAVIENLERAGAVLCAKLSVGALAWGDVWFGGTTRNPWQPAQGSSGSSAGSCAATAAGAVPFAIGSETLGSIVSPSARCGCSSLRPTFGAVDTRGAMALSWTMDKLGPICRSADDAALVFQAMLGAHAPSGHAFAARFDSPVAGMRVGYVPVDFERQKEDAPVLDELRALGVELVPIALPDYPVDEMMIVLASEAAAAFDELTRSNRDDLLARQIERAWPNEFRVARLIPAVEYIQAQRLRTLLMHDMEKALSGVAAFVHPTQGGPALGIANLTGHPCFVAPFQQRDDGTPRSICFTGQLFGEAELMALAQAWQRGTAHHRRHPPP